MDYCSHARTSPHIKWLIPPVHTHGQPSIRIRPCHIRRHFPASFRIPFGCWRDDAVRAVRSGLIRGPGGTVHRCELKTSRYGQQGALTSQPILPHRGRNACGETMRSGSRTTHHATHAGGSRAMDHVPRITCLEASATRMQHDCRSSAEQNGPREQESHDQAHVQPRCQLSKPDPDRFQSAVDASTFQQSQCVCSISPSRPARLC